jgi:heat shock protein HtpX
MKFLTRSLFILLLLYGAVFALGDAYLMHVGAPVWIAVLLPICIVLLQYLLAPFIVEHVLDIEWDDAGSLLPARNREFLERLCAERGIKMPRLGMIRSGTPNAFSFGRVPGDARIVATSGLLEILSVEESNAVLAHELGHVEHWDFLVMTFAALAPMLLYQIFVFSQRINNLRVVAYGAYFCYVLSQFAVLMLNRTREYWADHYAAEVTGAPDALSSALVKIAYGMVRAEGQYREAMASKSKEDRSHWAREQRLGGSMALMGISNLRSGSALALSTNPAEAAAVMRWDLVNPWARVYEMNSSHPLTALRVRELNGMAESAHHVRQYPLPEQRAMQWGWFPLEVLLWAAPFLVGAAVLVEWWEPQLFALLGISLPAGLRGVLLVATGAAWILRTMYRYRGDFQDATVGRLLEDTGVSQMRPRAVQLRGTILGRGVPGAFWSPDLVLRDDTGIIFVLYRQTIPFARFLFGIGEAESYIGQQVTVQGWFRRGMAPYVEMSKLVGEDGDARRAYSRWVQLLLSVATIAAGIWMSI